MCTSTALIFVAIYSLGIPVYIFISLAAYLSPRAKTRHAGSPLLARYKVSK